MPTTVEIARRLGVKPDTIRRQIHEGNCPAPKGRIGNALFWTEAEAEAAARAIAASKCRRRPAKAGARA